MTIITRCALLFVAVDLLVVQPALSQEIARNETVANRARPELDASGVPLGSFRLYPELGLTVEHNTNVFADGRTQESDLIYVASPELQLHSDWSNHALVLGTAADTWRFTDFEDEDHSDLRAWMEGQIDVSRSAFLRVGAEHAIRHEGRDSADDARGIERTRFEVDSISVSYQLRPGITKVHGFFEGEYSGFDFDDVQGTAGVINNDDRDRQTLRGTMRLGYDALPTNSLFFQASLDSTDYDTRFDDDGFERSSSGYEFAVGTTLDYTGTVFGELSVGYLSRTYDDQRFEKVDGVSFGAEVSWNVSGLTTVTIGGGRTIEATTIVDAAGVQATRYRVGIDHELLRNLILSLSWATVNEDFRGIDREDEIDTTEFAARYLMNRRVELVFGFNHTNRGTTPDTFDGFAFSRDIFNLTVEVHL